MIMVLCFLHVQSNKNCTIQMQDIVKACQSYLKLVYGPAFTKTYM